MVQVFARITMTVKDYNSGNRVVKLRINASCMYQECFRKVSHM